MQYARILGLFLISLLGLNNVSAESPQWWYAGVENLHPKSAWLKTLGSDDTVCLLGHKWLADGSIRLQMPARLVTMQKKIKFRAVPLLTPGNENATRRFLRSPQLQKKFLMSLLQQLRSSEVWSGIHLDMEHIPSSLQKEWIDWLYSVKAALRTLPNRTLFTAAVFPALRFKPGAMLMHPPAKLAAIFDEVVVMGYDWHGPEGNPGPVSDIYWLEENLDYLLSFYSAKTLWLGLPLYGYGWTGKHTVVLSRKHGMSSARLKKYKFTYTWLPDDNFLEKAQMLVSDRGLAGAAYWRAGFESNTGM